MTENFRLTTLPNGMRIASEQMPHLMTSAVGVWVDVGTRHEHESVNGVSHLLEHMAFKGTETRSAKDIAEAVENVGGQLNAYTSREHTAYHARILAEDLPLATEILADIVEHSTLDQTELERERKVVLEEIGQVEDTPDDLVFDLWQETAYPDQALGRSILGPPEIVGSMPRQALADHMRRHYGPEQMILVAAGQVEHERLEELGQRWFGDLQRSAVDPFVKADYRGGDLREERELEQVHLVLGLEALTCHDPDIYVLNLYSSIMGGGMSSRLFQEVREKRGLAYSVFSFVNAFPDTGTFGVYAGTGEGDLDELARVLTDELAGSTDSITEVELVRAKAQAKAGLLMGLEHCAGVCEDVARHLLTFGRRIPRDEILRRIDAVTHDDLKRVAKRLFANPVPSVTALGPCSKLLDHDKLAARLRH
ncbi:MAG TPA: pitrilysin family protein [Geminicoccus sp.]|jgi:predicted Zn-dependent peptidase|uniref:M16 family metallopeptidase n=1 Tax=Geminicoccus sp. TaxID=2024832 RepID=UPI002E34650B|nr:pitrilysin family protein [Geminicoccus sp.]HEX2529234.1 pitrilysin family protein [Geminicoccus sp.]